MINKSAVAIAADNAVTIKLLDSNQRLHKKIFNTANKVFALSKFAPVGIMVHNAMELGGIPWETLIKEYRKRLSTTKFDYLEGFAPQAARCRVANMIVVKRKRSNQAVHAMTPMEKADRGIGRGQNVVVDLQTASSISEVSVR